MKRLGLAPVGLFLIATMSWAQLRPVNTFSIVARDPQTGELGVAVQSHWFAVGDTVPRAEAGVGAVATQSFADASYGKLGLDLIRAGRSAPDVDESLPIFKQVFGGVNGANWRELTARLPKSGLLPEDSALIKRIQSL
jgi:Family of unknown function (DUF1028)